MLFSLQRKPLLLNSLGKCFLHKLFTADQIRQNASRVVASSCPCRRWHKFQHHQLQKSTCQQRWLKHPPSRWHLVQVLASNDSPPGPSKKPTCRTGVEESSLPFWLPNKRSPKNGCCGSTRVKVLYHPA